MQAGYLRKRVTIQQRSTVTDTFGGQSTSWVDIATVYAEITPMSGREWALMLALSALIVPIVEVAKFFARQLAPTVAPPLPPAS